MSIRLALWLACAVSTVFATDSRAFGSDYDKALKLYSQTHYGAAIQTLSPGPDKDARVLELLGKSYYMLGAYRDASDAFRKAIELDPNKSSYYHWLGRSYGRRAETAFPLAAPSYATKARTNFEKALELDPDNSENMNDLFEYYLQAPSMLGGGLDKAAQLADRIERHNAAEGAYAKARIAEQQKDWAQAETQLRKAAELSPRQPGRFIDLAKLLAKQGRYDESDAVFAKAHQIAPDAAKVYFAEAAAYIRANRKQEEARELLKKYLAMSISPDDPSKSEAKKLLSKVS